MGRFLEKELRKSIVIPPLLSEAMFMPAMPGMPGMPWPGILCSAVDCLRIVFAGAAGLGFGVAAGICMPGMVECWAKAAELSNRLPLMRITFFIGLNTG